MSRIKRTLKDDLAKFDGKGPYDKLNPCYMDGYFAYDMKRYWKAGTVEELRKRARG
jgi:hypothetical protein